MSESIESTHWSIPGSDGEPILGTAHLPPANARGVILLAHGFKGYKDYGMFPRIAQECAQAGFITHRFNFSHSGMTNDVRTFTRPELFERDTWNRQVVDLRLVVAAVSNGAIDGAGLPMVWFGHSRGGVTVLLAAGRDAVRARNASPAGVVTAAAPCTCNPLSVQEQDALLRDGFLESPSSRTGQRLRIGRAFLQEQLDDPRMHDLPQLASKISCPVLIMHGDEDMTVDPGSANVLARAIGAHAIVKIIPGADHVFHTPNPMPDMHSASPQLRKLIDNLIEFGRLVCSS